MAKSKNWRLRKRTSIETILETVEILKSSCEELRKIRIHVLKEEMESRLNHQIGSRYKKKETLIDSVLGVIAKLEKGEKEKKEPLNERDLAKLLVEEFFTLRRIYIALDTLGKSNNILTIANTIWLIIKALK